MDKKHFDDVLDYGIFDNHSDLDFDPTDLPYNELLKAYKYFTKVKTKEGHILLFLSKFSTMQPSQGDIGFFNKEKIKDGKYPLSDEGWILQIENGLLKNWLRLENYKDKHKGINFQIETIYPFGSQYGNLVFINEKTAPDGKYTTGRFGPLYVMDGKIVPADESNVLEFHPSLGMRILLFLSSAGLLLLPASVFSTFFEVEKDLVEIGFLLLAIYLIGWSCYGMYIALFYKASFDGDDLIMGSSFYQKTIQKKDVQGYAFFKKGEDGRTIVLVKHDGNKIVFDQNWGSSFEKIKEKIMSEYPKVPSPRSVKYHSVINRVMLYFGGGFLFCYFVNFIVEFFNS